MICLSGCEIRAPLDEFDDQNVANFVYKNCVKICPASQILFDKFIEI